MQNKNDESDQSCDETRSLLMQYCSRVLWLFGNDECGISGAEQTMEYHGIIKPSSRSSFFFFLKAVRFLLLDGIHHRSIHRLLS